MAAGFPWRLAGALERGERDLRSGERMALVQILGFPERWYLVSVDELCPPLPPPSVIERLDRIIEMLGR